MSASTTIPQTPFDRSSGSGPQQLVQSRNPSQTQGSSSSGLRLPSNKKTIYDRNLNRTRNVELGRASFAFVFMEMVSYAQNRVKGIQELEKEYDSLDMDVCPDCFRLDTKYSGRLNEQGHPLGLKLLDLLLYRSTLSG